MEIGELKEGDFLESQAKEANIQGITALELCLAPRQGLHPK